MDGEMDQQGASVITNRAVDVKERSGGKTASTSKLERDDESVKRRNNAPMVVVDSSPTDLKKNKNFESLRAAIGNLEQMLQSDNSDIQLEATKKVSSVALLRAGYVYTGCFRPEYRPTAFALFEEEYSCSTSSGGALGSDKHCCGYDRAYKPFDKEQCSTRLSGPVRFDTSRGIRAGVVGSRKYRW
mmetsp:Transcript_15490/g.33391  ORF Transcript_15490/g.33391 Transcript_15490/m.33391 type:complete len:186 (+) Transcript_15490:373-930(+)